MQLQRMAKNDILATKKLWSLVSVMSCFNKRLQMISCIVIVDGVKHGELQITHDLVDKSIRNQRVNNEDKMVTLISDN